MNLFFPLILFFQRRPTVIMFSYSLEIHLGKGTKCILLLVDQNPIFCHFKSMYTFMWVNNGFEVFLS